MTTSTRIWVAALTGLLLAVAALAGIGLAHANHDATQLTALRKASSTAQQTRQITAQQKEITSLQNQVTALTTQLTGDRQDVITCIDLQTLGLQDTYGVTVDSQNNISLNQTPVTLPAHCLNSGR